MLKQFTKQYSLSKTLRFRLIPINETAKHVTDFKSQYLKDVVKNDKKRNEAYQAIKPLIDDCHREYIERCLSEPVDKKTGELFITANDFEEAFLKYKERKKAFSLHKKNTMNKDEDVKKASEKRKNDASKAWKDIQESLRKKLVKLFQDKNKLLNKELITEVLPKHLKAKNSWEEHHQLVEGFKKFTTYFKGFNTNRENMYSSGEETTAISHRLINENLPKFFDNCINYEKTKKQNIELFSKTAPDLLQDMQVSKLDDVFKPAYFIKLFTQTGIDFFQELCGGKTLEDGHKIQGLNEHINLFRQKHGLKKKELPYFTKLKKQILSKSESRSFLPEAFENDEHMLNSLKDYIKQMTQKDGDIELLKKSIENLQEAELDKTYVKSSELSRVSNLIFGNYAVIKSAIEEYAKNTFKPKTNGKVTKKLEQEREKYCKQKVFTIAELENALIVWGEQLDEDDPLRQKLQQLELNPIQNYFIKSLQQAIEESNLYKAIDKVKPCLELKTLNKKRIAPNDENDQGSEGFLQVQAIHEMLEAFMTLSYALKPLSLNDNKKTMDLPDMDQGFYIEFAEAYDNYSKLTTHLYNKVRNHLTKKPFSKDKIKINFESSTLLGGWDLNKETDNKGVLLRKESDFYLAIMPPKHKKTFLNLPETKAGENTYEKVNYKQISKASRDLIHVLFSKKGIENYNPSQVILELYKNKEHTNGETFKLENCHKLIDFFKAKIPLYKVNPSDEYGWDVFDFNFSPTNTYKNISDFYKEVDSQAYKIWFTQISEAYIDERVSKGELFLFKIYNKDFSKYSKGKQNLHTIYWKALFEECNIKDTVIKLNGEAEIFYRAKSIEQNEMIIHPAQKSILNKNEHNPKKESCFSYDITKDRRFTQDQFFFHVPITLNFKSQNPIKFNDVINKALKKNDNTHVIGIDRGERHLLYYTVVNQKGEIVEQNSLNQIATDQNYLVDYQQKLHNKEQERDQARKSWSSVENIKELKSGYLSHVVHKLASLIVKYDAIVCLEDLNFGFKKGRIKIEKQVYQRFEKALIDKLNYLVFKDAKFGEAGYYLNAYQLTAPFKSFKDLGKQSGILFYVQAAYTSKIDPATGFISFLNTRYESLLKSKTFFENMCSINYNKKKDYFEFSFDYDNYPIKQNLKGYRTKWTVCTHGDTRYHNKRNDKGIWESVPINVTEELKKLFKNYAIEYEQGQELKDSIAKLKKTSFYKKLFELLKLTLSLRHSKTGTDEDFILSPVPNANGEFFDSKKASDSEPKDADANGSYNIALKGLWNLQQIKKWDETKKLNLNMKNTDWFSFALNKPFRD